MPTSVANVLSYPGNELIMCASTQATRGIWRWDGSAYVRAEAFVTESHSSVVGDIDADGLNEIVSCGDDYNNIGCIVYETSVSTPYPEPICNIPYGGPRNLNDGKYYPLAIDGEVPPVKTIAVTSPNTAVSWTKGTTQPITWTYEGSITNVKIELYKNGGYDSTIVSSTSCSSGSYPWAITQDAGTTYRVRINDTSDNTVWDASDVDFSIVDPPQQKSITVTAPNDGEAWQKGTQQWITWSHTGTIANVKIELYSGGIPQGAPIISSTPCSDHSYQWLITQNAGTTYKIKITDTSDNTVWDESNNVFSITEQPVTDSITITAPNGDESWQVGSTQTITWESNFNSDIAIELYKNDAPIGVISGYASNNNGGTFDWPIPIELIPDSDYTIKLTKLDNALVTDYSDNYFNILAFPVSPRCWKCNGNASEYQDFPIGTECGAGDAIDYPYNTQPTCIPPETPGFELFTLFIGLALLLFITRKKR
jgi:hypothetical protein